jgi:hypothetical protein
MSKVGSKSKCSSCRCWDLTAEDISQTEQPLSHIPNSRIECHNIRACPVIRTGGIKRRTVERSKEECIIVILYRCCCNM